MPEIEASSALVMDDQADICRLVVHQLEQIGLSATGVCTKPELVAALEQAHPDLLLLDLSLGESDAIEIFQILSERRFEGWAVLMSGHGVPLLEHARRIGERSGIVIGGVLRKPFRRQDLQALLAGMPSPVRSSETVAPADDDPTLLQTALDRNWLEFWYQPKISLKDNHIVGAESLARIRHPERGVLAPAAFLPRADVGALHVLTLLAVESAFLAERKLSAVLPQPRLSVNLSGHTLHHPDLLAQLKGLRDTVGGGTQMILEVTESDVIEDVIAAQEFAMRAVLHGFAISIDDFGSGYSTFERLRRIPFSELKLERSLVDGCSRDRQLRSICQAAVQLGHDFEAEVVGEGVENAEDLETLRELGFDLVQGFHFARPLPLEEFLKYSESWQDQE